MTFGPARLNSRMLSRPPRNQSAFTLLELLTVIAIILILVGISVGTYGYANNKAARSRAEAEIRALATACENYKADNGEYPRVLPPPLNQPTDQSATDTLNAATAFNQPPTDYTQASLLLYQLLSGLKPDGSAHKDAAGNALKSYFEFKPNQLKKSGNTVQYLSDPWGNPYGYSTARFYDQNISTASPTPRGYNPTVDIWSTAGRKKEDYSTAALANSLWIKNW